MMPDKLKELHSLLWHARIEANQLKRNLNLTEAMGIIKDIIGKQDEKGKS